jgi:hypothetical protein
VGPVAGPRTGLTATDPAAGRSCACVHHTTPAIAPSNKINPATRALEVLVFTMDDAVSAICDLLPRGQCLQALVEAR